MTSVAGRRNENVLFNMISQGPQNPMPAAILAQGRPQVLAKPRDRAPHRVRCPSRAVAGTAGMLLLEFSDLLEFAEGFGFDGFGLVFGIEDGFEFLFLFVEGAHGFGVVEGEAAFLDAGVAGEDFCLAGGDWP